MFKKVLEETIRLWEQVVEGELLGDVDADAAVGAHYAQLSLEGTIELTASGVEKVEYAYKALSDLVEDAS